MHKKLLLTLSVLEHLRSHRFCGLGIQAQLSLNESVQQFSLAASISRLKEGKIYLQGFRDEFLSGCWVVTSLSSLPCGPFHQAAYNMAASYPIQEREGENKEEVTMSFMALLGRSLHHSGNILLISQVSPVPCGKGLCRIMTIRRQKPLGHLGD